ncbi:MAG: GNAT family N-acetyltransferase [Lachnospiraceae bacterium]|nr:GNAT family N-acetyltransferase [Lachnospiraceae bacterium]
MEKQKENSLYLRCVTPADRELLYLWCNDPQCRANSLNPAMISYEEHCRWFSRKMSSEDCYIYIFMNGESAVGQVRLDLEENVGTISYSIAADYRGRGLGYQMLQMLEEVMPQRVETLHAVVKEENTASQRCFEKLGYQKEEDERVSHYWKTKKLPSEG